MKSLLYRQGSLLAFCVLLGAFLGAFSVFLTNPSTRLKSVPPIQGFDGTSGELLNNAPGVVIGSFVVYHVSGINEALSISSSECSFPVVLIRKTGLDTVAVSVSDKTYCILSGDLKDGKFEMTSYLNVRPDDHKVTSIDMNADGIYDLQARQTKNITETKFFFEGEWYPYKSDKGKWLIQTPDGWREILKGPSGFLLR